MENTQIIAERIKVVSQNRGFSVKQVLADCNVDKNIVNKLANGKDTGTQTIVKIADYLECSADYLLGRIDNPSMTYKTYINGENGIQAVVGGAIKHNTVTISPTDEMTKEICLLLSNLTYRQKADLMKQIYDFVDETKRRKISEQEQRGIT